MFDGRMRRQVRWEVCDLSEQGAMAEWLGTTVQYEGLPLALRVRPTADTPERRTCLRYLGAVTHQLARVRSNGLPEPEYNAGLADLDHSVITALESEGGGLTVLIETLAGKRTYYGYVMSEEHARRAMSMVQIRFPDENLSLEVRADSDWGLYAEYRRLFPW